MIINPYIFGGFDPDAQAFITAANITDNTQKTAINQLVVDLKGYGIWSKMKAIYPFVGGTASTHKFNLKDPRDLDAAFRLVFNGGWTHSSTGALPNGTNAFADTYFNSSTQFSTNSSAHLSYYSRTNTPSALGVDMGCTVSATSSFALNSAYNNTAVSFIYQNPGIGVTNTNTLGYFLNSRINSTSHKLFKNNVQLGATDTISAGTRPNLKLYLGCYNDNGIAILFTNRQCAFSTIGDGLTDTDATNLSWITEQFQTTLGRSVNPWYDNGNLLLDNYPSAAVAYSVRKLRNYYIGAAVRVRRSSDNAEQDIYFNSTGNLDTASLQNFVGYQNYIYYSEQFQNAYWTKTNTAISADATTDPIGGTTADKLQENTTNGYHNVNTLGFTAIVNNYYTYSVYLKSSERTFCNITLSDNATGEVYVVVDLSNGTIGSALGTGNWTNRSAAITNIGNGWYRVSVTAQKTVATVTNAVVNISLMQNSTTFTYAGTTGNGIFIWGAQLVDGILPGTYQQTTNVNNTANGFVTRWYDQSGNSNNVTQTTAANQPRIVNAGSLETISGKASMQFDGANDAMYVNFPNILQPNYYSIVTTKPNLGFRFTFDSSATGRQVFANSANENSYDFSAGSVISGGNTLTAGNRYLLNILANNTNSYIYTNNNLYVNGNAGTNRIDDLALGYWLSSPNTNNANIKIQEFIIYSSDQSTNRTAINTNINSYFNIYP